MHRSSTPGQRILALREVIIHSFQDGKQHREFADSLKRGEHRKPCMCDFSGGDFPVADPRPLGGRPNPYLPPSWPHGSEIISAESRILKVVFQMLPTKLPSRANQRGADGGLPNPYPPPLWPHGSEFISEGSAILKFAFQLSPTRLPSRANQGAADGACTSCN